jgi:phage baseplate assembly protein W
MAIEHKIIGTDSVESLAAKYFKDASRWTDIVDYNRLTYPYIVQDRLYFDEFRARGYLTVTRSQNASALTILPGSVFKTRVAPNSGIIKEYVSVEEVTILQGESEASVFVQCTVAGTFGNTLEKTIIRATNVKTPIGNYSEALTVTNTEAFSNGMDVRIKAPGEIIFIPNEEEEDTLRGISSATSYLNLLGGEDIELTSEGFISEDTYGDIGSIIGLDNIIQAITHRLTTEKGSDPRNPEYGANMSDLIGRPQTDYLSKLMELDVYEALAYEDRIEAANIDSLETSGTSIKVEITFRITRTSEVEKIKLDLDYSRGGISHVRT